MMNNLILAGSIAEVNNSRGEIRAGGTDVSDRYRFGVSTGNIVDISRLPGMDNITVQADGSVKIGAMVKLDTVANDAYLIEHYPGLAMAAGALATPQIRWMATMGGVLLQRNRCWYFRHPTFNCFKKGGDDCPAREGDHRFGVIFDLGPCVFPHPSTVGMMLLAYEAQVEINEERMMSVPELYGDGRNPAHDHQLSPSDLLTTVLLPSPTADERASYFRSISRARAEWALVEAGVRLVVADDNQITMARVVAGGVANVPLRLPQVEEALIGRPATEATFEQAAQLASEGAAPLPQTGYKVPLLYGTVLETIDRAYKRVWGGEG
jgi:xanthine dehydrogenase YagS FAD-binding subunit